MERFMRVLVTGATGFIGSAILDELRSRGHDIVGLARSESSANALREAGLDVHRGNIAEPRSITSVTEQVDAVIHTAFNHDFSQYVENCKADGQLLDVLARALVGTNKALVATSVTMVTQTDKLSTESDSAVDQVPRSASEAFLSYSSKKVQNERRSPSPDRSRRWRYRLRSCANCSRTKSAEYQLTLILAQTVGLRFIAMMRHGSSAMLSASADPVRDIMRSPKVAFLFMKSLKPLVKVWAWAYRVFRRSRPKIILAGWRCSQRAISLLRVHGRAIRPGGHRVRTS